MFRLSDGEEIVTLAFFVLIQYNRTIPECDGQTDGQTADGQTDGHICSGYTSACIACYANALVKTILLQNSIFSFTVYTLTLSFVCVVFKLSKLLDIELH